MYSAPLCAHSLSSCFTWPRSPARRSITARNSSRVSAPAWANAVCTTMVVSAKSSISFFSRPTIASSLPPLRPACCRSSMKRSDSSAARVKGTIESNER